jgi:hypothetical protein
MTVRLAGFTLDRAPGRLPGIRAGDLTSVDLENPPQVLFGWNFIVSGNALFMVSPPGWHPSNATLPNNRDAKGPTMVYEIPRDTVFFHWKGSTKELETVLKGERFETGAIGPKKEDMPAPLLAKIPANQIGDA